MNIIFKFISLFLLGFICFSIKTQAQNCATCPAATCIGPTPLQSSFNTGTNVGGTGILPAGTADLNWEISTTGINGTYNPAIIIVPNAAYFSSPFPNATWIAHTNTGAHTGNIDYYYKIEFELPCYNECGVDLSVNGNYCLTLDYFADNSVTAAYVNGVAQTLTGAAIPDPYTYRGFDLAGRRTGTLCNNWRPGINQLIVKVSSGSPYQAFLAQSSMTVVPPPLPVLNITSNLGQICLGQNATFNANHANGGINPSFQWQVNGTNVSGANGVSFSSSSLQNGDIVKLIMTPTTGCGSPVESQVTVNLLPIINTSVSISPANPEICAGASINFTSTGVFGTGTPQYTWYKNGAVVSSTNSYSGTGLLNGDQIVVRQVSTYACESNGTVYDTVIVKVNDNPTVAVAAADIVNVCVAGANTGSAIANGSIGLAPYSYSLNGGGFQSTNSFNGLSAGNYTVQIRDNNGCEGQTTFSISQSAQNISATSTNIIHNCSAANSSGSVQINASGGAAPYSYSLNGGLAQASNSFSSLASGVHDVLVTDINNCFTTLQFTIQDPAQSLTTSVLATNIVNNCIAGSSNGSSRITASGGFAPYSYSLNNGTPQTTDIFTGLSAGTYNVTVNDVNGCVAQTSFNIVDATQPLAAAVLSNQIAHACSANATGAAAVTASGGFAPYSYSLNNGIPQTSNSFTNLAAGTYQIELVDANGCTAQTAFTVLLPNQPIDVTVSLDSIVNNCSTGAALGIVKATGLGGFGALTYSLNNGAPQASHIFNNLSEGSYTIEVRDTSGCTAQVVFQINDPQNGDLTIQAQVNNVLCNGNGDGSILSQVSGGYAPYTFSWSHNGTLNQPDALMLVPNNYALTVVDNNGCTAQMNWNITEPSVLASTITQAVNVLCFGDATGSLTVEVTGGIAPYLYSWNTNPTQNSDIATQLIAGTYGVTVTDANGCIVNSLETITQPTALVASANSNTNAACRDGFVELFAQASGGTPAYQFLWSNGVTNSNQTVKVTQNQNYSVTVIDGNGCVAVLATPISIHLSSSPNADFSYNPEVVTDKNPEVTFNNQSTNASVYTWLMGDGGVSYETNPIHLYTSEEGEYDVVLIAASVFGCQDTAMARIVVVSDFIIYIPNSFTPNGDKLNNRFLIAGKGYKWSTMIIANRWGDDILKLEGDQPFMVGWDGTEDGKESPIGTYMYRLEVIDMKNKKHIYYGKINLIR